MGDMGKPSTLRRRLPQLFAALSATLGGFSLGAVLGWTSPASEPLRRQLGLSDETVSWLAGVTPLGALAAMLAAAVLLDRVGRRRALLATAPPFVAGWLLLAFCRHPAALLVGRFVTGFCGGAFSTAAPVYIGEIAEKDIRGALGVCYQLLLTGGILYVYVVGKWAPLVWLSVVCAIPPILFFVLFFFVPESPIFLLSKDRREEAIRALHWFRGGDEADITDDLAEMEQSVTETKERTGSLRDMFTSRAAVRGLAIGVGLQLAQQLSGVNIIIFFSVPIFVAAGTSMDPSDCAIVVGVVQVASTLLSTLLVERAGRRVWLVLSLSGMGVCMVVLGVYFHLKQQNAAAVAGVGWLPLLAMCAYLLTYSLGTGPLPWAMIGELFPGEIKGIASSICGGANWILCFIVSKTFTNLVDAFGTAVTFWVYAGICFVAATWIFFFVIETRNKPLAQIQKELAGKS
ncbi:facilitated trehalose transporter Tret1-like [Schistocerca nitens]|uniref:facilitated trehalose transporter Tret1-like n=1 Tax=Schistocerca nitens TaxID=7011 RepID=UPI002117EA82|nr:facilitated trehalose transporter Tret1-like [Schistocerca nitens]